jgi:hypothetical protein
VIGLFQFVEGNIRAGLKYLSPDCDVAIGELWRQRRSKECESFVGTTALGYNGLRLEKTVPPCPLLIVTEKTLVSCPCLRFGAWEITAKKCLLRMVECTLWITQAPARRSADDREKQGKN